MLEAINGFQGENRFLSNFWPAEVTYGGFPFPTVEHGYVAAKSSSPLVWRFISTIGGIYKETAFVKKMGSLFVLRPDWDSFKLKIMADLIDQKFNHPELTALLKATAGRELIEGNTWGDTFWGICNGVGENHLGKTLMAKRSQLLSVSK